MNSLKRIVIEGKTAIDVQGIGLREEIQRIARDMKAKGFVHNIKGKPEVEVICEAEKVDDLYKAIEILKSKMKADFNVFPPSDDLFDHFTDFDMMREDDLTEMVWGLLGAGKVFARTEKSREENRKQRLYKSLTQEMNSISVHVSGGTIDTFTQLRTVCIENFLKEPPLDTGDDLLKKLNDICDLCRETNEMLRQAWFNKEEPDSRIKENTKKIADLTSEISKEIGGMNESGDL